MYRTRLDRFPASLALAALAGAGLAPGLARAQTLETFVLTAGGDATCGTFATPAPVHARFGPHGVSEPVPGFAACGVVATQRFATGASGTLTDALTFQRTWGQPAKTLDGSTSVRASYGNLRATAYSTYVGPTSSFTVSGSEGFATFRDALTISSPGAVPGSLGYVRIRVRVSGELSTTTGTSDVEMRYLLGDNLAYTLFRGQAYHPAAVPFLTTGTGTSLDGFTLGPGVASGSDVVETFLTPFYFGTPIDFELRVLAYAVPSVTGVTAADFRARVVEFEVYSGGQPVGAFHVSSASGTAYGSRGGTGVLIPSPMLVLPWPLRIPFGWGSAD